MRLEEVRLMDPKDVFFYWMKERHRIHLKRSKGVPKPWTDDEILQANFFTNPYRENDKTTAWFRENFRDPLRNKPEVFMATVTFRWFNRINTGEVLKEHRLLTDWDPKRALRVLRDMRDRELPIFTGAFKINSPAGEKKVEAIVRRVTNVWKHRKQLLEYMEEGAAEKTTTMRDVHKVLTRFDGLGGFMAYELVCDLRYTYLLEHAEDKDSWCNPGPGAVRGLYRLLGRDFPKGKNDTTLSPPKDWQEQTQALLREAKRRLKGMPPLEMREIEMSLCEVDKYLRVLHKDGRSRRKFAGKA